MEEIQVTLEPQDNNRLSNLCGPLNDNIKILENLLDVKINQRGNLFHFIGKKESVEISNHFSFRIIYKISQRLNIKNKCKN